MCTTSLGRAAVAGTNNALRALSSDASFGRDEIEGLASLVG